MVMLSSEDDNKRLQVWVLCWGQLPERGRENGNRDSNNGNETTFERK